MGLRESSLTGSVFHNVIQGHCNTVTIYTSTPGSFKSSGKTPLNIHNNKLFYAFHRAFEN